MSLRYNVIEIFTSEGARHQGKPVAEAVIGHIRSKKVAARCLVTRGIGGCYESGEIVSSKILDLSHNMPLKIEIVMPAAELHYVLPGVEDIVTDGIVVVEEMEIRSHRTSKRLLPRHLLVRDAMTPSPVSVPAETFVSEAVRTLLSADFNALPVVDQDHRPIGIVTQGDLIQRAGMPVRLGLIQSFGEQRMDDWLNTVSGMLVSEVMTYPVTTIAWDRPLTEAVDSMLSKKLKRLPVVDDDGKLAGMIARLDVFRVITSESPDWEALARQNIALFDARFVRDVMRRDVHAVQADTPVEEVLKVIDTNDIQRVVVLDDRGKLLGIISDRDLLAEFSEHRGGLWDLLLSKVTFGETAQLHKEVRERARARKASDVMKSELVTVREDTAIEEAVRLMVAHQFKRLPVVDDEGRFRGMVSRDSILRAGMPKE